ncbi:MAG TPA: hypothetical protein VI358_01570 [Pseudolabrys sp.]
MDRYRKLANKRTSSAERLLILRMLAEEEIEFIALNSHALPIRRRASAFTGDCWSRILVALAEA